MRHLRSPRLFSGERANSGNVQAVFFDLDGTLVELPDDFAGLLESALADRGVTADPEHAEHYFEAFFDHLDACRAEPYRMAMADLRETFDLDPTAEGLAESYTEHEAAATSLRPGVREVLDELVSSDAPHRRLGVLTNGGVRAQRRKLEHHNLADRFDAIVVSGDVGAGKPDPEIFAAAKEAIPADEYVFVADDLERDVLPAQEAGFTGIYLADEDEADEQSEDAENADQPDETVTSLREVSGVLD